MQNSSVGPVAGYVDAEGIFHAAAPGTAAFSEVPKQFTFSPQAREAAIKKREEEAKHTLQGGFGGGKVDVGEKKQGLSLGEATKLRAKLKSNGYQKIDGGSERGMSWTTHLHPDNGHTVMIQAPYMGAKGADIERKDRKFEVQEGQGGTGGHPWRGPGDHGFKYTK